MEQASPVVSVSELLRSVRDTLERRFPLLWVRGELSNLSRAPSGHWYFTLKAGNAQVDCGMFRSREGAGWLPDVPQPRRRAGLAAAGRNAGRGARAGDAIRAARTLPAHGRGPAP